MTDRTRRPRGAAKGNERVYGAVVVDAKNVLTRMSNVLHVSEAQAIEALLLALPLDADGVPRFVDRSRYTHDGRRRPRGAAKGNPVVYGMVAPEAKAVLTGVSVALNDLPQAQAMEAILLNSPRDIDGVPTFVDRARFHREELPIPAA